MAQSEELNEAFRFLPPHRIGDPAVLLESILAQVEVGQRTQVMSLFMDSMVTYAEANLKFVQGVRSVLAGSSKSSSSK
ncbi:MAG: hypothetical protein JO340_15885 [Acidobacteriaceae bacterium]|nr:hypothetical protein [Acidobacteriaceae bacterium]